MTGSQESTAHPQARQFDDASIPIDVHGTLVGWVLAPVSHVPGAGVFRAWIDGPEGRTDCPCSFTDFAESAAGPGRYSFHVDGVAAGDLQFSGVDARLPR